MRLVKYTDEFGYRRLSMVRDDDPDDIAKTRGLPQNPPDLEQLDWNGIKRDLHNLLVDRGLITWRDVQASGNGVSAVIVTVLKRHLIDLYKLEAKDNGSEF